MAARGSARRGSCEPTAMYRWKIGLWAVFARLSLAEPAEPPAQPHLSPMTLAALQPAESVLEAAPSRRFRADDEAQGEAAGNVVGPHSMCPDGSQQYSGRLPAGGDAEYFFWLAEARSEASQSSPLVLWLNGGPGCASTTGLLTENGPCVVAGGNASAGWQMQVNPWSWNSAAHVLWVDQPAGVGFSTGSLHHGDESNVAEHMLAFLRSFYARFPKFLEVPLFVFGESYAGHYVPAIAARLVRAEGEAPFIKLAGVGLGNAAVDPVRQFTRMPEMACTGGEGGSLRSSPFTEAQCESFRQHLPECRSAIEACRREGQMACFQAQLACASPFLVAREQGVNQYDLRRRCQTQDAVCSDPEMHRSGDFLNDAKVQQALGVVPYEKWEMCNHQGVAMNFVASGDYFTSSDENIRFLLASGMPVLVYNGDCDLMVSWVANKAWAESFAWPHLAAWKAAVDEDFVLGDATVGRERSSHGLTFVQIYNAGHMVPHDQPQVALGMLQRFISADSPWRQPHSLADHPAESAASPVLAAAAMAAAVAFVPALTFWRRRAEPSERYVAMP